jgi:fructosamine-3-kinase
MATEFIPETAQAAEPPTSGPRRRLPRRARGFYYLTEADVRAIVMRVGFSPEAIVQIQYPEQGINNQTYIVQQANGPDLVIKVRPVSSKSKSRLRKAGKNNPYWPRYTQELFGPYPNGDISTLPEITRALEAHGGLRVPHVYLDDTSLELVPAPYLVSERLRGVAFDWSARPFTAAATRQLGEHLAMLHSATGGRTFGIYARHDEYPAEEWWAHFTRAYHTMLQDLTRASKYIASIRNRLEVALAQATATGTPASFPLVCIDQSPTHYLSAEDGRISGMIDVEAHLWAPQEYELTMVELWLQDVDAFRRGYSAYRPWPAAMDQVRSAYTFMTWMEWIYCSYTLLHDEARAVALEQHVVEQCGRLVPPSPR